MTGGTHDTSVHGSARESGIIEKKARDIGLPSLAKRRGGS